MSLMTVDPFAVTSSQASYSFCINEFIRSQIPSRALAVPCRVSNEGADPFLFTIFVIAQTSVAGVGAQSLGITAIPFDELFNCLLADGIN